MMSKVRTKASFDFQCAQETLSVTKIDSGTYGATGCGKRATYVGKDGACWPEYSERQIKAYCQVVSDTFVNSQAK